MVEPKKKNTPTKEADQKSPLGLPRASERLKSDRQSSNEFENIPKREYDESVGLKGDHNPPLKEFLPNYKTDEFLRYIAKNAKAKDRKDVAEAMRRLKPELFESFQLAISQKAVSDELSDNLPSVAPALWEERATGREVSPADFIRQHYAPWLGQGLTRAYIGKLDEKLYVAYARQISRSPEKALAELPSEPRQKRNNAEEALERIRAQTRASVARSRKEM